MFDAKVVTLLALLESGGYTAAASRLGLTQPAVSHQIRQLEKEFGIQIFYRNRKELKTTPEGDILIKYARRCVAVYHSAQRAIADSKTGATHFAVGLTPTAGENLLPQVIATLCSENPQLHIRIAMDTIQNLYNKLEAYELDFAIVEGTGQRSGSLVTSLLDTDYLCLVTSPQNRLASRGSIQLPDLRDERLILRSPGTGTRRLFEDYLRSRRESIGNFNVMMEVDNIATIKELVAMDLGITIIAHSACRGEEASGRLAVVPIAGFSMVREINIVHPKDFSHPEILDSIRSIYAKLR